jgi:lipopolysaccharide biosynthesis regulator YciM
MAKYKIQINSIDNVKDLLQETYRLADEQIKSAQDEMNKLINSTKLQDEVMEGKGKYAKAMNDYMTIKDKSISRKLEIAKLLTEIYKHNGDVEKTLNDDTATKGMSFDFSKIREIVNKSHEENDKNKVKTIELNKK